MPSRLAHLTARFFQTVAARPKPGDVTRVNVFLAPGERELFRRLRLADQRHSIDLSERLQTDGHAHPDLIRAALLHDVGKAAGRLPLPHRVVYSFCANFHPSFAGWLGASPRPFWRRPFYLARHHARIGAEAARAAGSSSRVVALIAGHESPGRDELSHLLYDYDRHGRANGKARGGPGKD